MSSPKTFTGIPMGSSATPELWSQFKAISDEIARGPYDANLIGMVRELYCALAGTYRTHYRCVSLAKTQLHDKHQPGWYLIDIAALRKLLCCTKEKRARAVASYFQKKLDAVA